MLDVRMLLKLGVAGVIIGRALYDGRVSLKEALATAKHGTALIEERG